MSIQALPAYLLGYNCSLATIAGATVDASGLVTPGTASSFKTAGVFDLFEFQGSDNLTMIKPADYSVANYVPVFDDFTVRVGEIERPGIVPLLWSVVWLAGAYFRVSVATTFGGAGPVVTMVVIAVRESLGFEVIEEKNACVLTGRPIGILPFMGTGTSPI